MIEHVTKKPGPLPHREKTATKTDSNVVDISFFSAQTGIDAVQLQYYTRVQYIKKRLKKSAIRCFQDDPTPHVAAPYRRPETYIHIEKMTRSESKNGGEQLLIYYRFIKNPFGKSIIASTEKGICYTAFHDNEQNALRNLKIRFPHALVEAKTTSMQDPARAILKDDYRAIPTVKLHVQATDFQLEVWKMLLKIPMGMLSTYGAVARQIKKPKASRAVGTAIGSNPIAFLIPCHRIVQATGMVGGYRWGVARKIAMIGWEALKTQTTQHQEKNSPGQPLWMY